MKDKNEQWPKLTVFTICMPKRSKCIKLHFQFLRKYTKTVIIDKTPVCAVCSKTRDINDLNGFTQTFSSCSLRDFRHWIWRK